MEPVPGSTSGHTQVDYMNTILYQPIVDAMMMEYPLQVLWALITTVRQQLVLVAGNLLFSTLMTHFGMDKVDPSQNKKITDKNYSALYNLLLS